MFLRISYLLELRHPVPRPNLIQSLFSKNQKDQYIVGAADSDNDSVHKQDLDYMPMSPGH